MRVPRPQSMGVLVPLVAIGTLAAGASRFATRGGGGKLGLTALAVNCGEPPNRSGLPNFHHRVERSG